MGYRLIKYLEAAETNVKQFYLDDGEVDLPPIRNYLDIMPGSEALDITSKKLWILNSEFQWVPSPWRECGGGGGGFPDAPTTEIGAEYVRKTNESGFNEWEKVHIIDDVPTDDPKKVYVRKYNDDGTREIEL